MKTPAEEFLEPLKKLGKIDENETFESLFQKPYNELEKFFEEEVIEMMSVFDNSIMLRPFYALSLGGVALIIEKEKSQLEKYESKTKANKIIKWLQNKAFISLHPLFLSLFKWDFNRRIERLRHPSNSIENQKEYISKALYEIDQELAGNSDLAANKYTKLILIFLEEFMNEMIDSAAEAFPSDLQEKYFEGRFKLSETLKRDNFEEFIDEDLKTSFSYHISEIFRLFKNGLQKELSQPFDFIINAFAHALIDYKAFLDKILESFSNTNELEVAKIKNALLLGNFEDFVKTLKSLFASIPNILVKNTNEAYYHIYTWLIVYLSGCEVIPEDWTNIGRIDLTIKTDEIIYLLEFKVGKTGEALKQIENKKYYEKYLTANRRIIYAGITFDAKSGNINEYEYKELE